MVKPLTDNLNSKNKIILSQEGLHQDIDYNENTLFVKLKFN